MVAQLHSEARLVAPPLCTELETWARQGYRSTPPMVGKAIEILAASGFMDSHAYDELILRALGKSTSPVVRQASRRVTKLLREREH